MIKPEVLDAMVAAGCTAQQIAAAVKADQGTSSAAARQARYRARKASQSDERDVTSVTVTEAVSPKKETSPTPPKEKTTPSTEPNGSLKTRATRLPDDFWPDIGWAVAEGMSPSQAQTEASQFRDYWTAKPGKDGTKLDWPATWRQWVRNQLKRRPPSRASPPRQPNVADGFAALHREIETRNDPRYSPSDESPRRSIPHLSRVQIG